MKYLISFANEKFKKSQVLLEKSAYKYGIDKVINYSPSDYLNTEFYFENKEILDKTRGCGYWLWKPWIILKTLEIMNENDFLLYSDSGAQIINKPDKLFKLCKKKKHLILFSNSPQQKNILWTRRSVFESIEGAGLEENYLNQTGLTASFIVVQKNEFNLKFLNEWFNYCKNPELLLDVVDKTNEYPEFIEHRHDQSILSLLALKYNLETFRDPSQWGNDRKSFFQRRLGEFLETGKYNKEFIMKNSPYLQIFNQHRGNI